MPDNEQAAVIRTEEGQERKPVLIDREELLQLKGRISRELEYLHNKAVHLANAMQLVTDAFDADRPENRFSLSTFGPVVAEIGDELDELRSSLWGG